MGINPNEPLIDDQTPLDFDPELGRGLIPRDYGIQPVGSIPGVKTFGAVDFPLIPRSEWSPRIKEMEETKSRLSDIRDRGNRGKPIPYLDQGPIGYCWAHSTVHALMLLRAAMNQPYRPLSAFAVAAIIMQGRDEGGWSALSLEWIMKHGCPTQEFWPQGDRNLRRDTPEMRSDASRHQVDAGWIEPDSPHWDRDLSFDQFFSLLLARTPVPVDLNWWGHAVCAVDPVEVEPGSYGVRIMNSHRGWGDNGMGVLRGNRAIPDNAVAPYLMKAS